MRFVRIVPILAACAAAGLPALPDAGGPGPDTSPLATRNYHPFVLPLLGMPPEAAAVGELGRWRLDAALAETNSILDSVAGGGADLFADLETTRVSLALRRPVTNRVEVFAELPLLARWGGAMDEMIEVVERVFNALNPVRPVTPVNDVRIRYERDGVTILDTTRHAKGAGDLLVGAKWLLRGGETGGARFAVRAAVEIPTGDEDELFGNGAVDAGAAFDATIPIGRTVWHGSASVVLPGDLDAAALETRVYGAATIAAALPLERTALVAQVSWYSSPFENGGVPELDDNLVELSVGARFTLGPSTTLTIAGVENLVVRPAADFTLIAGVARRF